MIPNKRGLESDTEQAGSPTYTRNSSRQYTTSQTGGYKSRARGDVETGPSVPYRTDGPPGRMSRLPGLDKRVICKQAQSCTCTQISFTHSLIPPMYTMMHTYTHIVSLYIVLFTLVYRPYLASPPPVPVPIFVSISPLSYYSSYVRTSFRLSLRAIIMGKQASERGRPSSLSTMVCLYPIPYYPQIGRMALPEAVIPPVLGSEEKEKRPRWYSNRWPLKKYKRGRC
ncbi:hypothetical protein F5X99DRAFT_402284 [Biscogniauxia marginata]|nr:hypothetical protein F5X99DRAFT_402284 [Biscogniauxia marginata]